MRKLLALSVILASPALAQQPNGTINAPIYATGYISQVGGTNVTTTIKSQPNHPTNLNIYTTDAISSTWTINLPNPAFEGQVLSFNCGAAVNTISVNSSDGSALDSAIPTSCVGNSGFTIQFDQRLNIWRNIGSNATTSAGVVANNNTQLTALPATISVAMRLGYAAAGDAPPVLYTRSNSACSLNAGAGDGGSQVPTSDGKCWIASLPAGEVDARVFGADPTAVSPSTVPAQNAINYAQKLAAASPFTGASVYFPAGEYIFTSSLSITENNITIRGDGKGKTLFARNASYGDTFVVNNNAQIQNITFKGFTSYHDIGFGGVMSGAHLNIIGGLHITVDDVNLQNGRVGILIQGGVYYTINNVHIQGTYASGVAAKNSLAGLYVVAAPPANVVGGAVYLPTIVNVIDTQVNASGVDAGWEYAHLINAGEEIHFTNVTFNTGYYAQGYIQQLGTGNSANAAILEITYTTCFFDGGATPVNGPWYGLWISGAGGNGSQPISRITLNSTSINGEGVVPVNTSFGKGIFVDGTNRGGTFPQALVDFQMNGGRIQGWYRHAADVQGGNSIQLNGVRSYSNNTGSVSAPGINMGANVSRFLLANNVSGGIIGTTDLQTYGISIENGASGQVVNNDLCLNTTGALNDATAAPTTAVRKVLVTNNACFNGNRAASSPAMPASTVNQFNPFGSQAWVSVYGGTVSDIKLNGQTFASGSNVTFPVGPQDVVELTYTVAPSWIWWPQ